jgi:chromosome segregation protein
VQALEAAASAAAAASREAAQASGQAAERARITHERLAVLERRALKAADERLERIREERERVEAELAEQSGGLEGSGATLLRLGTVRERLAARLERAASVAAEVRRELEQARALARRGEPAPAELELLANESAAAARSAATERDDLAERARAARDRLAALERSLAEREGISPAARTLSDEGARLALSALEVEPGAERAVAAALNWRASALLVGDARSGLELLDRAREGGLGSLAVVAGLGTPRRPEAPVPGARPLRELAAGDEAALGLFGDVWLVEREQLLAASHGTVITEDGYGYDVDRGELWFAGETAEALLLELDARRRALADEAEELKARAATAATAAEEAAAQAAEAESAYAPVAHLRERSLDAELLERVARCGEDLERGLTRAAEVGKRVAMPLAARSAASSHRATELRLELQRIAGEESEARRDAGDASKRAEAAAVEAARLGGTPDGTHVETDADHDLLAREAAEQLAAAEAAAAAAREAGDRARAAEAALLERAPRRSTLDQDLLARLTAVAAALGAAAQAASGHAERLEAPVRARVDAGAKRAADLGAELRRLGAAEVELRQGSEEASERATAVEIELARLEAEADEARRRLGEAGPVEPAEGDDRDELAARTERLDARREALGQVNPLAKQEYEAEKERLADLSVQRQDLEDSLSELERLRDDLTDTVQRRFTETFDAVARHFEDVASTLFPGGEGRLRLVEPEAEEGEAGIEVELRPAGKRITRLSLLSGGEKALGAISFLFALFLAKPCPFYLLDEVEAALDDTNIARFVELLRRYSQRAQFVVITHQKRTMEAADILYGVTMGADGVSEIVSRRLPREHAAAVGA